MRKPPGPGAGGTDTVDNSVGVAHVGTPRVGTFTVHLETGAIQDDRPLAVHTVHTVEDAGAVPDHATNGVQHEANARR